MDDDIDLNAHGEELGDELKVIFGKNVKIKRLKKGLRQIDFAKILGVGQQYVSDVELGEIAISIHAMAKFAVALDCSVPEMLIAARNDSEKK